MHVLTSHHASDTDKLLPIAGASLALGIILTIIATVYHLWLEVLPYMP